jgi:hypothetical protein
MGTQTLTFCSFTDNSGGVHRSLEIDFTATGVGDQGSTYTLTEHKVISFVTGEINAQGNGEHHGGFHLNYVSQGSAPNFVETCVSHVTIRNFQIVASDLNDCTTECSGSGTTSGP